MRSGRQIMVVLLLIAALAGAGFSFYSTFLAKPKDTLTPEQREKAMQAVAAFSSSGKGPGAKARGK